MSKRPKWKSFRIFGFSSILTRFGASFWPIAIWTRWQSPSPPDIWMRHRRSRCGFSPIVSQSIATTGPRSSPSGKSFLYRWFAIFYPILLDFVVVFWGLNLYWVFPSKCQIGVNENPDLGIGAWPVRAGASRVVGVLAAAVCHPLGVGFRRWHRRVDGQGLRACVTYLRRVARSGG